MLSICTWIIGLSTGIIATVSAMSQTDVIAIDFDLNQNFPLLFQCIYYKWWNYFNGFISDARVCSSLFIRLTFLKIKDLRNNSKIRPIFFVRIVLLKIIPSAIHFSAKIREHMEHSKWNEWEVRNNIGEIVRFSLSFSLFPIIYRQHSYDKPYKCFRVR